MSTCGKNKYLSPLPTAMKVLKGPLLSFLCLFVGLSLQAQDSPPTIVAEGDILHCVGFPIPITENVMISDPDSGDDLLDEVIIQISEGYSPGEDILQLGFPGPNITTLWQPDQGILKLTGPATFSEFVAAIEGVTFETTQVRFDSDKIFSINLGSANFLPSTGHYYFYVEDFGITWEEARIAAENTSYFGLKGYLATLTSAEEATLAGEQAAGTGWIGGSDAEEEGVWKWVTGPEAGTVFWNGLGNGSAPNGEFAFWNTNEPNNCCGGEDYAHVTDPSVGIAGSWNDLPVDGGANTQPDNPFSPKGYVVEFGGTPGDPEVNLSASTRIITPKYNIVESVQCGPGPTEFQITTNTEGHLLWYDSPTSPELLSSDVNFQPTISETTTFYVLPIFSVCEEGERVPITATVNPLPTANSLTVVQCDDGFDNDGVSIFNLEQYEPEITDGETGNTITFYDDVELENEIDPRSYTNSFNSQGVFAVVTTTNGCEAVAEITLVVSENNPDKIVFENCDDEIEDGVTSFNLMEIEAEILDGASSGVEVSYFSTFDDALLNQNRLPNEYTNQTPNSEIIVARLTQGTVCFGLREVELRVLELPQIESDEEQFYCLNSFPATITLSADIENSLPSNYTFSWSTGETTKTIMVNSPGQYTVAVSSPNGCEKTKTISVLPSEIATITSIEVRDLNDNNTVIISVSGEGSYQFAIESVAGPYQDSNRFDNLSAGFYTVYVRDIKNDCGIVAQSIAVIGYPKYFTPNGDSFHDTWSLRGVSEQFQPNSKVVIYDRYGTLIKSLNSATESWDGTYNGALMPSSDYWFIGLLQDGRRFKGHFALKR